MKTPKTMQAAERCRAFLNMHRISARHKQRRYPVVKKKAHNLYTALNRAFCWRVKEGLEYPF